MPEITTEQKNGHVRHIVKVKPGEQLLLCRCYESKNFPFCDGTHSTSQTNIGPAAIEVEEDNDVERP